MSARDKELQKLERSTKGHGLECHLDTPFLISEFDNHMLGLSRRFASKDRWLMGKHTVHGLNEQ